MRIISPFRDYYDSVQTVGQDRTMVYVRKVEKKLLSSWIFPTSLCRYWSRQWCTAGDLVVGFCGRIYPVLHFYYNRKVSYEAYCFTLTEVDEWVCGVKEEDQANYWGSEHKRKSRYGLTRESVSKHFETFESKRDSYADLFTEARSPVFVALPSSTSNLGYRLGLRQSDSESCIHWNARLNRLNFAKVKDPYTAFQEISQFLGSLAFPDRSIPEVSDEDMLLAKGFDAKTSFRKPKRNC